MSPGCSWIGQTTRASSGRVGQECPDPIRLVRFQKTNPTRPGGDLCRALGNYGLYDIGSDCCRRGGDVGWNVWLERGMLLVEMNACRALAEQKDALKTLFYVSPVCLPARPATRLFLCRLCCPQKFGVSVGVKE